MGRFTDRVAVITGAGAPDGIGATVARHLVAEGARVVLGATSDRVHDRAELGDAAVGVIADLTAEGSAESLVDAALQRWGRLDIVVNNAGMTSVSSGWDADDGVAGLSLAQWDAAIARNLTTAFLMSRRVPVLTAAGYGRIVSVGSTTGPSTRCPAVDLHRRQGRVGGAQPCARAGGDRRRRHGERRGTWLHRDRFTAAVRGGGRGGRAPIGRSGTPDEIAACAVPRARVGVVCHRRGAGRRRRARPARNLAAPIAYEAAVIQARA